MAQLVKKVKVKVAQSCLTLCDPMDFTGHGILRARMLEWVAFPFSRDLPNPGIEPRSPALQADSLPAEPPGKPFSGKESACRCRRHKRCGFGSWVGKIPWRRDRLSTPVFLGFPHGSAGKESACNARDLGSIPGLGRSLEKGKATHSSILAWRIPWTI